MNALYGDEGGLGILLHSEDQLMLPKGEQKHASLTTRTCIRASPGARLSMQLNTEPPHIMHRGVIKRNHVHLIRIKRDSFVSPLPPVPHKNPEMHLTWIWLSPASGAPPKKQDGLVHIRSPCLGHPF
jgi:hypothetical protein